ncbi:MAG: bifunctional glycosyltransferase family 2/GtrA family protein [Deltaproteobacteria bacterium]|jgi:glycosyltransferase involved in cell wall biosynthesis|nr:bifunctional glycosyltransferase family 2/GtrA family protein [Deltaproteobacteria bacterium]
MIQTPKNLPWVLIPSYQGDQRLLDLVDGLIALKAFARIIVVNDGSSSDRNEVYAALEGRADDVTVLKHAVNRGKGQALKTGLNHYLLAASEESKGLVCCDADGQHLPKDIENVAAKGGEANRFTLGVRVFGANTPFRSKFGNTLTSLLFGLFTGYRLGDTQTGLRFIPWDLAPFFLQIPYDRFDYEFASLVQLTNKAPNSILQVPIETVYLDENASSHYRALKDSVTIGAIFFKFFFSSITTTILDYVVFALVYFKTDNILLAFILARVASIIYNFSISRFFVFKVKANFFKQLGKYLALVTAFMLISWAITETFFKLFGGYVILTKLIAEGGLFFVSWFIQKRFIFVPKKEIFKNNASG